MKITGVLALTCSFPVSHLPIYSGLISRRINLNKMIPVKKEVCTIWRFLLLITLLNNTCQFGVLQMIGRLIVAIIGMAHSLLISGQIARAQMFVGLRPGAVA
jgi:hypothetical protein